MKTSASVTSSSSWSPFLNETTFLKVPASIREANLTTTRKIPQHVTVQVRTTNEGDFVQMKDKATKKLLAEVKVYILENKVHFIFLCLTGMFYPFIIS